MVYHILSQTHHDCHLSNQKDVIVQVQITKGRYVFPCQSQIIPRELSTSLFQTVSLRKKFGHQISIPSGPKDLMFYSTNFDLKVNFQVDCQLF